MKILEEHLTVLDGVQYNHVIVGTSTKCVHGKFRHLLEELIEAGFVKQVTAYRITKRGVRAMLKHEQKDGLT